MVGGCVKTGNRECEWLLGIDVGTCMAMFKLHQDAAQHA